jgi:glutathione S-transferase
MAFQRSAACSIIEGMILVGNYLSPYVRRVAVSLNLLDIGFELQDLFVFNSPDTVRELNPVVRIPVLVLDDGTRLVESAAILDEIDQMVGPARALTPPSGLERRRVTQLTALGIAVAEKAQWAFYERRVRPEEKVHEPWIEHNEQQVIGGLTALDEVAHGVDDESWIAGTEDCSQADITTSVAFIFAGTVLPRLTLSEKFPNLARLVARCEGLDAFARAPLPPPP